VWPVDQASPSGLAFADGHLWMAGLRGQRLWRIAVSADGTKVYHGDNVFTVTPTTISLTTPTTTSGWDNSHTIIGSNLFGIGTDSNWYLKVYSLANPAAPTVKTTFATKTTNQARSLVLNTAGSRMVASGWAGLKSFSFDGNTITEVAGAGGELRDGGAPWPASNTTRRMYRSVSMNNAGNLLASAYFTNYPNTPSGAFKSGPPSGYILASLATDGSMALVSDTTNMSYARVAKFFKKP